MKEKMKEKTPPHVELILTTPDGEVQDVKGGEAIVFFIVHKGGASAATGVFGSLSVSDLMLAQRKINESLEENISAHVGIGREKRQGDDE